MKPERLQQLKEMPEIYRILLKEYLEEEITKMDRASNIDCPAEEMATQVIGRKEAIKTLRKIIGAISPAPKIVNRNQYK